VNDGFVIGVGKIGHDGNDKTGNCENRKGYVKVHQRG